MRTCIGKAIVILLLGVAAHLLNPAEGQEKSVRPGINQPFENPDVKEYLGKFEVESREVFTQRKEILAACKLKPGMVVADVGAGTGLFTRLFARAVGPAGKVYAVDIAKNFVDHVEKSSKAAGLNNVVGVVCTPVSVNLPPNSVDLVFICDTYHHFEFPLRTMASIHEALRPGGQVVLIDFRRIEGKSREWILNHVRAGEEVVTREIMSCGFKKIGEENLLKENYFLRFARVDTAPAQDANQRDLQKFQGDWVLIAAERDGKKMAAAELKKLRLTIQGNEFILKRDSIIASQGSLRLDAAKSPKAVDETITSGPNAGKVFSAIYELDDDQHTVCFAAPGKERPTSFTSVPGSGQLLQVWRRQPK
jgi:uncharacterized protein (TIGR03067 family)